MALEPGLQSLWQCFSSRSCLSGAVAVLFGDWYEDDLASHVDADDEDVR